MTAMALPFDALELLYEELAAAIDAAGEENSRLFLAKLALKLAHELGDREAVADAIRTCLRDLPSNG